MGTNVDPHPSDDDLKAYVAGILDEASIQHVGRHLGACRTCLGRAAALSPDDRFSSTLSEGIRGPGPLNSPALATTEAYESRDGHAAADDRHDDSLATELANHPDYTLVRELGRGGMGVVYLAHNRLLGRDEVLKVIGRHVIDRADALDRFLREIRAVARLRHRNVVTAYTAFRSHENLVFAMEYVEGLDLARMVSAHGPMPVAHACQFIHQAALGLEHAHELGMVHRDIKPSNLMLSSNRDKALIKILDFGLARAARENTSGEPGTEDGDSTLQSGFDLTGAGQVLGTPAFIAPEQILASRAADIRADIYSLGCTLYYLVSGGPPFTGETVIEVLRAHTLEAPGRSVLFGPRFPPSWPRSWAR